MQKSKCEQFMRAASNARLNAGDQLLLRHLEALRELVRVVLATVEVK